jgi:hypothetical protein
MKDHYIKYTINTEALFLFLILLLGLVLCSFLGGREGFSGNFSGTFKLSNTNEPISGSGASTSSSNKYDNYNHFTRNSTRLSSGSIYYGPQGTTASVFTDSDGSQSLQIVLPGSSAPTTFQAKKQTNDVSSVNVERFVNFGNQEMTTSFFGPNGATASVINTNNGQNAIRVETPSGTYYYNISGEQTNRDISSTQYYGSTGTSIEPDNQAYNKGSGYQSIMSSIQQKQPNSATNTFGDYSSALPPGIPRSQIPPGHEDLYILKSQVVPPVCPVCPQAPTVQRQERCPPCPACARCPESPFECKKVPNYNAINSNALPLPVLADFSQFGM